MTQDIINTQFILCKLGVQEQPVGCAHKTRSEQTAFLKADLKCLLPEATDSILITSPAFPKEKKREVFRTRNQTHTLHF